MLKRLQPTTETIRKRGERLRAFRLLEPLAAATVGGLEPGNSKTGTSGSKAATVLVWNLPAVVTCPGASKWCLSHCYNGDDRPTTYPVSLWQANWHDYDQRRAQLKAQISAQLHAAVAPTAVRIHSSGDFFSENYIRFWIDICLEFDEIAFWAYTRSWVHAHLRPCLEELRALRNVQLFASHDFSMPEPPADWRVSRVCAEQATPARLVCPEQTNQTPNCASCGYCFQAPNERFRDVTFYEH